MYNTTAGHRTKTIKDDCVGKVPCSNRDHFTTNGCVSVLSIAKERVHKSFLLRSLILLRSVVPFLSSLIVFFFSKWEAQIALRLTIQRFKLILIAVCSFHSTFRIAYWVDRNSDSIGNQYFRHSNSFRTWNYTANVKAFQPKEACGTSHASQEQGTYNKTKAIQLIPSTQQKK